MTAEERQWLNGIFDDIEKRMDRYERQSAKNMHEAEIEAAHTLLTF